MDRKSVLNIVKNYQVFLSVNIHLKKKSLKAKDLYYHMINTFLGTVYQTKFPYFLQLYLVLWSIISFHNVEFY